jgi:outer membrane receptor protein involved in Fe transport
LFSTIYSLAPTSILTRAWHTVRYLVRIEVNRMKRFAVVVACLLALAAWTVPAAAQSTTGTISGRVVDSQGLALPGVTVNATSPNLQGVRSAVTSGNGDYIFTGLPSGTYTLAFELSGFQNQSRTVTLAPTQVLPLDVQMGVAALSETVNVVGRSADVLTQTAQVATNFKQELIATLPTTRDINASLLLAPAVHPTGPSGAYSVAGSMSFETLYMVNGVNVSENLRGQANNLYIEDAIQETNVSTAGISAEYGRFGGGVVNVITKSGGNQFSGSFRDTLNNDNWRTLTPFENTQIANDPTHTDTRVAKTVPTYEYTAGGPIMKDHLWFFTAGRLQTQESGRSLVITNIPYTYTDDTKRFEGKGTFSVNANHSFQGAYTKIVENQTNNTFNTSLSMDTRSLNNRQLPQDLSTGSYNGVLTSNFFVEGRVSSRHFTFQGDGAPTTDLINGTLLLDGQRGNTRFWSPTFCGVCDAEKRDNTDLFLKGTYFAATQNHGSHNVVFGYDLFNDKRFANNHQSGSDYRIFATTSYVSGQDVIPEFLGDGTTIIQWNPIPEGSQGTNFRTHSLFVNDNWRVGNHLTANVGIRWDKNDGADSAGRVVAKDNAFSPRVGVVWDPTGEQKWSVTASFAKYVAAISNSIADSSSPAGNPQTFQFIYKGPNINASGPTVPTAQAVAAVFAWYAANGGSNLPFNGAPTIPGLTPVIQGSLDSPHNLEYATGVARQFGSKAAVRADYVFRDFRDFYVSVLNTNTGKVQDQFGKTYDLAVIQNSNDLTRRYQGVTTSATYRFNATTDIGGNYTLSHAWGNVEGENVGSGPITTTAFQYPEYKQASWNYPVGDLSIDQRHRARLWINYGVRKVDGLTLSLLEALESGVPYGASQVIPTQAYVTNPGYITPPGNSGGSAVTYFFTARDAFRTDGQRRTDFAANYVFHLKHNVQLFGQLQIVNLFNQFQLCGCGATVFDNGGNVTQTRIDQTVQTVANNTSLARFNPFTTTPVLGTNWKYGPNFGTALNRFAYTSPQQFRVSFGVRF